MKTGEYVQQGDVIIEVSEMPKDCKKLNHLVLADGEVTGHKHQIIPQGNLIELYEKNGEMFVKAKNNFKVKHEEHDTIELPEGIYKIRKVQEFDHFENEARNVRD